MRISQACAALNALRGSLGDVEVVLYDGETGQYYLASDDAFEPQRMPDSSMRVCISVSGHASLRVQAPAMRHADDGLDDGLDIDIDSVSEPVTQ